MTKADLISFLENLPDDSPVIVRDSLGVHHEIDSIWSTGDTTTLPEVVIDSLWQGRGSCMLGGQ